MSAFIVARETIAAIVGYYSANSGYLPCEQLDAMGQMLWDENHKQYNYRYRENLVAPRFVYESAYSFSKLQSPAAILAAIHCLDYQCSEHDDYQKSETKELLMRIEREAMHKVLDALPEYREAPWK